MTTQDACLLLCEESLIMYN